MFVATHYRGFNASPTQVLIEHTDDEVSTSGLTEYTFADTELGAAHSNRQIVVCIGGNDGNAGRTISSVTVGGISGSQLVFADGGSGATHATGIWSASVPSGTTGDIVVTWSAGMSNTRIAVYRVINAKTSAHDTGTDTTATSEAVNTSVAVPGFGGVIGSVYWNGTSLRTNEWTNLTEKSDAVIEGSASLSTGSDVYNTAQASLSITATASGSVSNEALSVVSFAPL